MSRESLEKANFTTDNDVCNNCTKYNFMSLQCEIHKLNVQKWGRCDDFKKITYGD